MRCATVKVAGGGPSVHVCAVFLVAQNRVMGTNSTPLVTGFGPIYPHAKEHRARVDGRATDRHLHGRAVHTVRCATVKVSAELAGVVASNVFLESLTTRQSGRLAQNLMVVLAHLQSVAATFRSAPPSWTTL